MSPRRTSHTHTQTHRLTYFHTTSFETPGTLADPGMGGRPHGPRIGGFLLLKYLTFGPFCMKMDEKLSASGTSPTDPHHGLCSCTPLWALYPDPRYRLALHELAMVCAPLANPGSDPVPANENPRQKESGA